MERILLYYPSINIPDGNWLRSSLLYTDKVASIFPFNSFDDKRVNTDTRTLYDIGLYKPIFVLEELNPFRDNPELEKFEQNFIKVAQSTEFKRIREQSKKNVPRLGLTDNEMSQNTFDMYLSKISFKVADYLRQNGDILFRKNETKIADVRIEKTAAIVYMSMLSDFLARKSKDLIIPSTDKIEFERIAYQLTDEKTLTRRIQLDDCLPTPSPRVNIKDIIKFKRNRKLELLKFRELIDSIEGELNSVDDDLERKRIMIKFQEKIQKEILEIKKLMGDSKLDFILSGFSSLLDFKQKEGIGTISGIGAFSAGAIANLPLIGLGAGALLLTGTLVSSYKKINRKVESNSASYIYYAQKAGMFA
jgi:hypothetical protein